MPSETKRKLKRDCSKVDTPPKNKSMLYSNTSPLSTGNAPNLTQIADITTCRTVVNVAKDVSLTDSFDSVEAFPGVVSATEETVQTIETDQPLPEQTPAG